MAINSTRLSTHAVPMLRFNRLILLTAAFVASTLPAISYAQVEDAFSDFDLAMYDRPGFEGASVERSFDDGLLKLWSKAIDRPDPQLQRLVVDTLALARQRGLEGVDEIKPQLITLLEQPEPSLAVIRAVARTLIVLEAREEAGRLAKISQAYGAEVGSIVEPALARWQSDAMEQAWLERVRSGASGIAMTTLAFHGLAAIESAEAVEPLTAVVRGRAHPARLRLEAAAALAKIQKQGLVPLSRQISEQASSQTDLEAILAIRLLAHHQDDQAVAMLESFASHPRTAVQAAALRELYDVDFQLVDKFAPQEITSPDVNVRRVLAKAMVDTESDQRIPLLAPLLDDVNPSLRRWVAQRLIEFGRTPKLSEVVLDEVTTVLNEDAWRGCEQAAKVLGTLDHEAAGSRMVELLKHPRGEVKVAAAWGLTQLRVASHLPDMLDHAKSVYEGFRSGEIQDSDPGASLHLAHLFVAFGDQVHRPAEPLLREYLPKRMSLGEKARAAAAWAIGFYYESEPPEDLTVILDQRLSDVELEPESEDVRQMCAVSLGRMRAESALPTLRRFANNASTVGFACHWSIEKMTGEPIPSPPVYTERIDEWFLAPVKP